MLLCFVHFNLTPIRIKPHKMMLTLDQATVQAQDQPPSLMPRSGPSFPSGMPSGLPSLNQQKSLVQSSELNACRSTMKNSKASKVPKEKRKKQSTLFDVTEPPVTKKNAKRRLQWLYHCGGSKVSPNMIGAKLTEEQLSAQDPSTRYWLYHHMCDGSVVTPVSSKSDTSSLVGLLVDLVVGLVVG